MTRILIYAVIVLAILGSIVATIAGIYHKGFDAGIAEIKAKWEAADRTAQEKATTERLDREGEAKKASIALQQAESTASDFEQRWKESRRASRSVPLAVCPNIPTSIKNAATGTEEAPNAPLGLRLTYQFLRDYDTAWTGTNGEPVFSNPPRPPETSLGSASPITLDDALDTHAENAKRCSENSRQLDKLTTLIKRLQGSR